MEQARARSEARERSWRHGTWLCAGHTHCSRALDVMEDADMRKAGCARDLGYECVQGE